MGTTLKSWIRDCSRPVGRWARTMGWKIRTKARAPTTSLPCRRPLPRASRLRTPGIVLACALLACVSGILLRRRRRHSELTDRTTLSLEEYSKMRPLQITSSSSLQTATNSKGSVNKEIKSNHQTSPPDSGIGPKHITQDTPSISIDLNTGLPHASPPFSPPPGLDKVGSILLSAKKMDAGTPAEKFWSTVGLENFAPYKMRVDGEGSTLSPTSNSKFFENLLEDKGSVSKPAKSSTETPSNNG